MPNRSPGQTPPAESDARDIQELVQYSSRHVEAHASHVGAYAVNQTNNQINYITIFSKNIQQNLDRASGTLGPMSCKSLCFAVLDLWKGMCMSVKGSCCPLKLRASSKVMVLIG